MLLLAMPLWGVMLARQGLCCVAWCAGLLQLGFCAACSSLCGNNTQTVRLPLRLTHLIHQRPSFLPGRVTQPCTCSDCPTEAPWTTVPRSHQGRFLCWRCSKYFMPHLSARLCVLAGSAWMNADFSHSFACGTAQAGRHIN